MKISVAYEWEEKPGDGRLCYSCECVMIEKMFVMVLFVNNKIKGESDTKIICETCKNLIDDSNSNP